MAEGMKTLSYDEAVQFLNRAVEEKGADYIYKRPDGNTSCVYFKEGKPDCIVGHVLSYLGITEEDLSRITLGYSSSTPANTSRIGLLCTPLRNNFFNFDMQVGRLFTAVQGRQDSGIAWGKAVRDGISETTAGVLA